MTPRRPAARAPLSRGARARLVAYVLWVCVVWGHSLVQGEASSAESGLVVGLLRPLFELAGVTDVEVMGLVVRKCAHFCEYAVLAALGRALFAQLREERGVPVWAGVAAVALVPVADETIQLFVPGRSGSPVDVCLDLAGAATGALLSWAWARWHARTPGQR